MVERAVGGADKLLQLIDKNKTGLLSDPTCQSYLADVMDEANGEVNGYVGMAADLSDPALQTAPLLIRYELTITVYLLWLKSTGGIAIPEKVELARANAMDELEKIGARRKGIGLPLRPTAAQPITQVTKKDTESYFSPSSPRKRFDGWS
jgi:hypothetical protein